MSNLLFRRIGLIVASLVLGSAVTYLVVIGPLETNLADYGLDFTIYTILCLAIGFAIVGDKFAGTKLLPK